MQLRALKPLSEQICAGSEVYGLGHRSADLGKQFAGAIKRLAGRLNSFTMREGPSQRCFK